MKAIAAKAAKAEAKRLSRNKNQREKRHEKKRQSECMSHETRDEAKLCDQDLIEEREEAVERIEQERLSALPKEETEKFDTVIRNFQTKWPTEHRHGWGEEALEWTQEGYAMEFTIDTGDPKVTSKEDVIEVGEGEHCNLWSVLGADDERVPERDPWDLGLELESPNIQRWADEKGWSEVIRDTVAFDKGWPEMENEDKKK